MRKLKNLKIEFVSLVPKGANKLPVIYKSDDGKVQLATLSKYEELEDRGELLSVVYAPELVDSQGDFADAETIRKAAHEYLKDGGKLDLRHNGKALTRDQAYVAESFIVQKGDPRFQDFKDYEGNPVDVTGGWAILVKILDPEIREKYKSGEWGGVSMAGTAQVEPTEPVKSENGLLTLVKNLFKPKEDEVEELKKLLKSLLEEIQTKKEETKEKEDLLKELEVLKQEVAALKAEKEEEEQEKKKEKEEEEEEEEEEKKQKPKLSKEELEKKLEEAKKAREELEKELEELEKASHQPKEEDEEELKALEPFTKEDMELFALGRKMAEFVNKDLKK